MGFMRRGGFPPIGENSDDAQRGPSYYDLFYNRYGYYEYYGEPVDKVFDAMYMVAAIITILVLAIMLFLSYKPTIIDPIDGIKQIIIYTYLALIVVLLVITWKINYFSKSEEKLISGLCIILAISMIVTVIYAGIKLNFDSKYTKAEFEKIYTVQKENNATVNKNIEKGEYVNECLKLNNVFSGKFYGVIGIHQLFNVLLICQIFKKINSKNKKDRLSKDDLILFDEEENVKM